LFWIAIIPKLIIEINLLRVVVLPATALVSEDYAFVLTLVPLPRGLNLPVEMGAEDDSPIEIERVDRLDDRFHEGLGDIANAEAESFGALRAEPSPAVREVSMILGNLVSGCDVLVKAPPSNEIEMSFMLGGLRRLLYMIPVHTFLLRRCRVQSVAALFSAARARNSFD
jgi:hypothetical protein